MRIVMMKMFEPYLKALNELIRRYVSRSEAIMVVPRKLSKREL
ncbi:MAG: hypothetical protein QXR24_05360 [Thermosphaera sp.]